MGKEKEKEEEKETDKEKEREKETEKERGLCSRGMGRGIGSNNTSEKDLLELDNNDAQNNSFYNYISLRNIENTLKQEREKEETTKKWKKRRKEGRGMVNGIRETKTI